MFNIPLFQNAYDWITIVVGLTVTAVFYYKYYNEFKSQQLLNSLPGIWTSLGLLFTFIAICSSMHGLQNTPSIESMEGEVLKKVGSTSIDIKKIIGDIIPAFTTSIIGLVAGLIMRHPEHSPRLITRILAGVIAELIMVSGYFAFEFFVYGYAPAAAAVPFNLIQAAAALIIAVPCSYFLKNVRVR